MFLMLAGTNCFLIAILITLCEILSEIKKESN